MPEVTDLLNHPIARERRAAEGARRVAQRFGLAPAACDAAASSARALVRSGCSSGWAISAARRAARRAARSLLTLPPTA